MSILAPSFARRLALGLAIAWVILECVAATGITASPHATLVAVPGIFLGCACLGAFAIDIGAAWLGGARAGRRALIVGGGGLALFAAAYVYARPDTVRSVVSWLGASLGIAAVLASAVTFARARATHDAPRAFAALVAVAALPTFICITGTGLGLTIALHPNTFDGACLHLDAALGGAPTFAIARFARAVPGLYTLCLVVYVTLPLALGCVLVLERRASLTSGRQGPAADALTAFIVLGLAGFSVYHLVPVAGPSYVFPSFPDNPPALAGVAFQKLLASGAARNGVPSLHTSWAILIAMRSARLGRPMRVFGVFFCALTLLATILLGEHYLVDLIVAVPFTLAVEAALAKEVPIVDRARWVPLLVDVALVAVWALLIRGAAREISGAPIVLLMIASLGLPIALRRGLAAARDAEDARDEAPAPLVDGRGATGRLADMKLTAPLTAVFFASGFAGLVYEVVFGKALALTFGSTAQASLTVLATYMGGMALGSWIGGRLASRGDPLRLYAYAELAVAAWCAVSPFTTQIVRAVYVALAQGSDPGAFQATLQIVLGSAVLLPATIAMGVTMPLLAKRFLDDDAELGGAVGLLYGANTLGAAAGALATGYFITPLLGIRMTTWVAVLLNVAVAGVGLALAARDRRAPPKPREAKPTLAADAGGSRQERAIAIAILVGGGFVTLALEVVYTHLLAVVAGNSTYAFSLMLFSFLVGLGLGSAISRRVFARGSKLIHAGALEICVAIVVLGGVFVWESIPNYFASYAAFPYVRAFAPREFVRFSVCCVAMVPPAIFIGALYPVALDWASRGHPRPAYAIGRAAALNTAGNIAGALAASLVLLPAFGSLQALHILAALALAAGLLPLLIVKEGRTLTYALAVAAVVVSAVNPRQFDLTSLASGANVYFQYQAYGKVIDSVESVSGGLTTVAISNDSSGEPVKTMLTNGKFQGDDSMEREVRSQLAFGIVPLLHTPKRDEALVIGFGVGVTTRALRDAGFARTDVVELSRDVLDVAQKHFAKANGDVLRDPSIHAVVADGRNFLLLHEGRYDVISLEISSIWFAGAASLYNREFYELAKKRLAHDGVLQQWVQLHHMTKEELASILATVRSEFPYVWLYKTSAQGQIVACLEDCTPRAAAFARLDGEPRLRDTLALFGGHSAEMVDNVLLDRDGIDRAVARATTKPVASLLSTDDNLLLEYATPRGNFLDYGESFKANLDFFEGIRDEMGGTPKKQADDAADE